MIIYPDIEIQDGKCVNLVRGDMGNPRVYDVDPIQAARDFAAQGAEALHVIDLDGVAQGGRHNAELICEIFEAVDVPVQVGGGIRTFESALWWFDHGADRIVVGSAGVTDRRMLEKCCGRFAGKVIVSVDVRGGNVMIDGWRATTAFEPVELIGQLADLGVAEIIFTDIDRDDDLPDATFALTTQVATDAGIPLISSGCVKTLDDVATLRYLPNIAGTVIGRALFGGVFTLPEALDVADQPMTKAALQ